MNSYENTDYNYYNRYYKGAISEISIWEKVIDSNDILNLNNKYNFQLNNQLDTGVGVTPLLGDAL